MHAGDDCGQWQLEGFRELDEGHGLADPRLSPQQHGQIGGHGQCQGFQLRIGMRLTVVSWSRASRSAATSSRRASIPAMGMSVGAGGAEKGMLRSPL